MLVLSTARPAGAQTPAELQLLTLTNQVRASAGVPPLQLDGALSLVATTWSTTMALAGTISHNPALKSQISGFSRAGENVGNGASVEIVHRALVASPGHYANIVNPAYSRVGLGVVQSGSIVYLTQIFIQPSRAAAPAVAPPAAAEEPPPVTPTTARRAPVAPRVTTTTAPAPVTARTATAQAAPAAPVVVVPPSPWHQSVMVQLEAWDRRSA